MNGPLENWLVEVVVCDQVGYGVGAAICSSVMVDRPPREGICDNQIPFGGSVFKQIRGVQRKPVPTFAIFQLPSAQNNVTSSTFWCGMS